MVRLKEELLVRVNGAVDPIKVYDILFKENWVSTSLSYPLHLVSEAAMTAD